MTSISKLSQADLLRVIEESSDEIKNLIHANLNYIKKSWSMTPDIFIHSEQKSPDSEILYTYKSIEKFLIDEKIDVTLKYEFIDNLFLKTHVTPQDICLYFLSESLIFYSKHTIVYVLEKFRLNIDDMYTIISESIDSTTTARRLMQIIFAFNELGLDPAYIKRSHIKKIICGRGLYVRGTLDNIINRTNAGILHILKAYLVNDPDLFSDEYLCNDVISDMLMDYNEELFTLYLKNGLHIYPDYFCSQYDLSINDDDTDYLEKFNPQFMIKLLKLYETNPDIFEPDAYEYILFIALRLRNQEIFEYIVDSNITSDQIKLSIDMCNYEKNSNAINNFINKYENELSAKDIASLLI